MYGGTCPQMQLGAFRQFDLLVQLDQRQFFVSLGFQQTTYKGLSFLPLILYFNRMIQIRVEISLTKTNSYRTKQVLAITHKSITPIFTDILLQGMQGLFNFASIFRNQKQNIRNEGCRPLTLASLTGI